ncbi:MAG: helix-hairpin-helix domain-containing protein [Clostridia bacterium]|nr:helix-hairpin-helix domain-containing protein [Clostridia bacterium]
MNKVLLKITIGFVMISISFGFYYVKNFKMSMQHDIVIESNNEDDQKVVNESIIVDVAGEVVKPSVLTLQNGSRVYEAINITGGFTEKANITIINLAGILEDGEQLYIPSQEAESNIVGPIPVVDLSNDEKPCVYVSIYGEVITPGVVIISEDARVKDVLDAVGGVTEEGNLTHVNLAEKLSDSKEIYISDNSQAVEQSNLININTASASRLQALNGIGEVLAQAIVEHRTKNGPFKKIEDIMKVSGIGQGKFNQIKEYISIY